MNNQPSEILERDQEQSPDFEFASIKDMKLQAVSELPAIVQKNHDLSVNQPETPSKYAIDLGDLQDKKYVDVDAETIKDQVIKLNLDAMNILEYEHKSWIKDADTVIPHNLMMSKKFSNDGLKENSLLFT